MKKLVQNTIRLIAKGLASLLAVWVTLVILISVALHGFVFWLNTDKGGEWIAMRLNTAIEKTGYTLEVDGFGISGFLGLKTKRFKLRQDEKTIMSGEDIALHVGLTPLGLKRLDIDLKALSLDIHGLPKSEEEQVESQEFVLDELPDVYFKTAQLNIDITTFSLSENILNGGLKTGVKFEQNVALDTRELTTNGALSLENIDSPLAPYIPNNLKNNARLSLKDQSLYLEELSIDKDIYKVSANGSYSLDNQFIRADLNGIFMNSNYLEDDVHLTSSLEGSVTNFSGIVSVLTKYKSEDISISSKIKREDALLSLSNIEGKGASINIDGAVDYNINTAIADGGLKANIPDLSILKKFIPALDVTGRANLEARLGEKEGGQTLDANAVLSSIQYQDYMAEKIHAKVSSDNVKDTKKLIAEVSLSNGKIPNIDIKNAAVKVTPKEGRYHTTLLAKGYSYNPFSVDAEANLGTDLTQEIHLVKMTLKNDTLNINASGRIQNKNLSFNLDGKGGELARIPFADLSSIPVTIDKVSASLTGTLSSPTLKARYHFRPTSQERLGASFDGETTYTLGTLKSSVKGTGRGVKTLEGTVSFPLALSLEPFAFKIDEQASVQGGIVASCDLNALSGLFLDDGYALKGALDVNTKISGALFDPHLSGAINMSEASFVDTYNDIQLTDISMNARLNDKALELSSLTAKDGERKGSMKLSGNVNFSDPKSPDINASLKMVGMHLLKNENYDAWMNADVSFKSQAEGYLISGALSPQEISIRLPDHFASSIPQLNIVEKEGEAKPSDRIFEKTKLDITFKADNKIFVSGRGLDVELEGLLDVGGTLKTPLVEGNLKTLRGRYEEFGRRFALEKALLRFQGEVPPSPYLDVEASTKVDDVKALVRITSSVEDPKIKLASMPPRPEDEVLSLILFGKDIQKISPFQAIQLANTLRKFSGKGGSSFDPLQEIQNLTGLDDIRVEGIGTEDAKAGAGKYISDRVYLEVEQGAAAGSGAASVEIEVTPNISVESKASQNGESDVGVFWEWSY